MEIIEIVLEFMFKLWSFFLLKFDQIDPAIINTAMTMVNSPTVRP